jgi:hypothetical protein
VPVLVHSTPASRRSAPPLDDICANARLCGTPVFLQFNGKTVGANLASIMDDLGPVNVEIGSVVSLGYNQNGERDIVTYLQHVRPVYFIPNHVTAVAVEGSSLEWKVRFYDG